MKSIGIICLGVLVLGLLAFPVLTLQPTMPAGKRIHLGNWKWGECDVQIWQRKNETIAQPFSSSLFVRFGTNRWHQHYLNHQDSYAPKYTLKKTNGIATVYRGPKLIGNIDISTGNYTRNGGGVSLGRILERSQSPSNSE